MNTSPLNRSSQGKNIFIQQNIINKIQPQSTKNNKNFLHYSKILNPKKNDFLKQYLASAVNPKKTNLKPESTLILLKIKFFNHSMFSKRYTNST